jgi:hypothetical protein
MSLLEICSAIQFSPPLAALRGSTWFFPLVATVHLMGLTVIGGAVLLVDLRLLGFGIRSQPLAELAAEAQRWLLGGLAVMGVTGAALLLVVAFTFSVRRRAAMRASDDPCAAGRLVALISLSLWTTVALGGRWIGVP